MSKNHIDANVTTEDLEHLPLTDVAERLIYDEATLNRVCERMIEAVQRILKRDLNIEDDAWQKAEAELTPEQKLAVWFEAIESLG